MDLVVGWICWTHLGEAEVGAGAWLAVSDPSLVHVGLWPFPSVWEPQGFVSFPHVVLLASSNQDLQHVLEQFAAAGMRLSTSKSKVLGLT